MRQYYFRTKHGSWGYVTAWSKADAKRVVEDEHNVIPVHVEPAIKFNVK